jgi:hypothetical protein
MFSRNRCVMALFLFPFLHNYMDLTPLRGGKLLCEHVKMAPFSYLFASHILLKQRSRIALFMKHFRFLDAYSFLFVPKNSYCNKRKTPIRKGIQHRKKRNTAHNQKNAPWNHANAKKRLTPKKCQPYNTIYSL